MSQFPLSDHEKLLSNVPASVEPLAELPAGPKDGLSAVQRDALNDSEHSGLVGKAIDVLRTLYDPEIPVNIYDLGLIYEVREESEGSLYISMTLTSPMCPVAGSLPPEVKASVEAVTGADSVTVDVVWDPPWSPDKMSEAARLQLNMF